MCAGLPFSPILPSTLPRSQSIKPYYLPTQAIIVETPLIPPHDSAAQLLLASATITALANCHITGPSSRTIAELQGKPRIQLSFERRSFALCCTTSHWSLACARNSLDASPRSYAAIRPIARGFKSNPRELSCNNTVKSRHDIARIVPPLPQNRVTSSDTIGSSAKRSDVAGSYTISLGTVAATLRLEYKQRKQRLMRLMLPNRRQ